MAINNVDSIGTTASQVFPVPIIAQRDPGNGDYSYPLMQMWNNNAAQTAFILVGFTNGLPVWSKIEASGSAGVFTSLVVNGNSTFTGNILQSGGTVSMTSNGAFTLDGVAASTVALFNSLTTGSISMGTSLTTGSVTIGGAQTTGGISIGGGVQTGTLTFGGGTGVQTVNLATGDTGAKTVHIADGAAANIVTLGSTNTTASTTVQSGSGGLALNGALGITTLLPATNSVSGTSLTLSSRVGVATFTGQTTAAASTLTLTITNTLLTAGQGVFCTVSNKGTNDAQMTLTRVNTQTAGTLTVQALNNGAAALNGDVIVTFWLIN